jgi:hypothetical protein
MAMCIRALALLFIMLATLSLPACDKEQAQVAASAGPVVPSSDLDDDWRAFVRDVAKTKYIKGKTAGNSVYVRFLGTTEAIEGHIRDAKNQFSRPMMKNSMMVYGSYNSRNMGQILVDAFNTPGIDGNLTGSTLVFIGKREDEARVREASIKSGVTLEFFPVD